jgi:prepilin-type N-terminal cleavage/methylation domain-containing protein
MVRLTSPGAINTQKGMTLLELVIALAVISIIASLIATSIAQVQRLNSSNSKHMTAVKQVENALHYMNRDIQMASVFQSDLLTSSDFPLTLRWTDYLDNTGQHEVTYAITDESLQRIETVDGTEQPPRVVATHVDATNSGYSYDGESVTVDLTISLGGTRPVTESRSMQVSLRASS